MPNKNKNKSDIDKFLDEMDKSRYKRYRLDRERLSRQFNGFRTEWNQYQNEYAENFSMD